MIKRLRLAALIAALVLGGHVLALQVTRVARTGDAITTVQPGSRTSVGFKPLTEMTASDRYKGEDGGLYGGGRNTPPESLNRTGFIGGLFSREDGAHGTTQQAFAGGT